MSCIYKGKVTDTDLSRNARGGTEMMRDRLLASVKPELLENVAIHLSRPRELHPDVPNILWAHDLVQDPENKILANGGWQKFAKIVFVSWWQREQYMLGFNIPQSHTAVIHNAIEPVKYPIEKDQEVTRFVYHTTPHRGLDILVPVFQALASKFENIHLDVFSSFKIYGWEQRDQQYKDLFEKIKDDTNMTYHGTQDNDTVLKALAKSHFFLYPSIWKETSCIAMIEAMAYKCIVIHPDLAALSETQQFGPSVMYEFHDDPNVHAQRAFDSAANLLQVKNLHPQFINNYVDQRVDFHGLLTLDVFASKWNKLLEELNGK